MPFSDTLNSLQIQLDSGFSSAQEARILSVLEQLYNIPAGKLFMDSIPAHVGAGQFFEIRLGVNGNQTRKGSNHVEIDFNDADDLEFVDNFGNVFGATLLRILTHEMIHAVESTNDPSVSDFFTAFYDYEGPTVARANQILDGIEPNRVSYSGADFNLTVGHSYTQGNEIDMAYIVSQSFLDQLPSGFSNNYNTSVHINPTRDLIIGNGTDDTFLSGPENDYLYGGGGADYFDAGSGNDFINGGNGADTVDYSGTDFIPLYGINATISASQITVNDNYGDTDTLLEVEHIVGTALNDYFSLVGDVGDFNNISSLHAGISQPGINVRDTIDFSGFSGQTALFVTLGESGEVIASAANTLLGFDILGFENVIGSDGTDIITGDDQANMLDGGAGEDILDGGLGQDIIFGGRDDDQIAGFVWSELGAPNPDMGDPLEGQVYAFDPGSLSSVIDGGEGVDTLTYEGYVNVRVGAIGGELAFAVGGDGATDIAFGVEVLENIDAIDFSAYQEGITFDAATLADLEAADIELGDTSLHLNNFGGGFTGSAAADTLTASSEFSNLNGAGGNDTITGAGNGLLSGGNGNDILNGGVDDRLFGGAGDDVLMSGGGGSELRAGSGMDTLIAQSGDIVGGDINDTLTIDGVAITGNDLMVGFPDVATTSSQFQNHIFSKDVVILVRPTLLQFDFDGTQASILWDGYVVFNPNASDFDAHGRFVRSTATAKISFKIGDFGIHTNGISDVALISDYIQKNGVAYYPTALPVGDVTGTIDDYSPSDPTSFEEYSGVSAAELEGFYTLREEQDYETPGVQRASGNGETFDGSFGESISYRGASGAVNLDLSQGTGSVDGVGQDAFIDINNAIGSAFDDVISGDSEANMLQGNAGDDDLWGNAGDDTLNGWEGNDRLFGGAGDDTMAGGAGDDLYFVDDAGDVVTEFADEGTDRVKATIDHTLADNVEHLNLLGAVGLTGTGNALNNNLAGTGHNDTLNGLAGNDDLWGNAGDDTLNGGEGNDRLFGGAGDDTMAGGAGDDLYFVDDVGDVVTELADEGIDRVKASVDYTLGDNVENLDLQGATGLTGTGNALKNNLAGTGHNDTLNGLAGNDDLWGNAGDDTLNGGEGNDRLFGGAGDDTLNGGAGDDTFTGGSGADIIELDFGSGSDVMTDFQDGLDLIDLGGTGLVFSDLTIVDTGTGDTKISFDDGDAGTALDELTLTGITASDITAEDFQFG